jgi:hypothetical protein
MFTTYHRRKQAMKQIAVKVAGSEIEPLDVTIKPGTTAGEILNQLNLEGYLLSTGANSTQFFGERYHHQVCKNEKAVYPQG